MLPYLPTMPLGRTGLPVSRLSFGTVYLGHFVQNLSPQAGAEVLLAALERGVTTWDTSDDYGTHPHVACALAQIPRQKAIVSSKISKPENSLDSVLNELGTDYLDILLAHCVELPRVEEWHAAIRAWLPEKTRSRVRAIGLSTHSAAVARLASEWPEVEVIMLPINAAGVTIKGHTFEDGGVPEMLAAAEHAAANDIGIIAMKVLGAGALANDPAAAIAFAARLPCVHSLVIGMRNIEEVDQNINLVRSPVVLSQ
jgi:aryl-alcohol dehydrogenase-like predicted oxidoreductase